MILLKKRKDAVSEEEDIPIKKPKKPVKRKPKKVVKKKPRIKRKKKED